MIGRIINLISGFYYVDAGRQIYTCKLRGRVKSVGFPLVGDMVEISLLNGQNGVIEKILPRRNEFIRPAVSNVDMIVFVASESLPVTDPFLIDRLSVIALEQNCDFALCINKNDISNSDRLFDIYKESGFPTIRTSAETGEGISELMEVIAGKSCVLSGNSGVGKSSLINRIVGDDSAQVGDVSIKLGRGKHKTRQVRLYELPNNTYIADTPGFASFDVEMVADVRKENLQYDFPDFSEYIGRCRFSDCGHTGEPGCAVARAVLDGKVNSSRYDSYLRLYSLVSQHKSWENV